jgi:hypothetical protein
MCSHPICRDAGPKMQCTLKRDLNDNLIGMVANVWNVSCECDKPGHVFRFDVESCVDVNECLEEELCNPGECC